MPGFKCFVCKKEFFTSDVNAQWCDKCVSKSEEQYTKFTFLEVLKQLNENKGEK